MERRNKRSMMLRLLGCVFSKRVSLGNGNIQVTIKRTAHSDTVKSLLAEMPAGLKDFWSMHAGQEFPNIPRDGYFYVRAAEGLMTYFKIVQLAKDRATLLPSKAADSVWHAWLEFDKPSLDAFCLKNFGRLIEHIPADDMQKQPQNPAEMSTAIVLEGATFAPQVKDDPLEDALIRTYVLNCILDGQDVGCGYIPTLFRLDRVARMPFGYAYDRRKVKKVEAIYHSLLSSNGQKPAGKWFRHDGLSYSGLKSRGYIKREVADFDNDTSSIASPFVPPQAERDAVLQGVALDYILISEITALWCWTGPCFYDYDTNRCGFVGESNVFNIGGFGILNSSGDSATSWGVPDQYAGGAFPGGDFGMGGACGGGVNTIDLNNTGGGGGGSCGGGGGGCGGGGGGCGGGGN